MKKNIFLLGACFAAMTLTISSCKKKDDSPAAVMTTPQPAPSLYERVGGTTMKSDPNNKGQMIEAGRLTLRSVVDSSILVIAADKQLQPYFATLLAELGNKNTSGLTALSKNLTDFMCSATGSKTYMYTGLSMTAAHNPSTNSRMAMKADSTDFNKFVGDIGTGLAQNGVTSATPVNNKLITDLVALLYTTEGAVVQK
jgi:hypothetical protein